jgi:hypothetical protein
MRKLFLIAMAITAISFTVPHDRTSPAVLPENFVGRCNACDPQDDLCGSYRVFVDINNPSQVTHVEDRLNPGLSFTATGTYSNSGGVRYVTGLSFTSSVIGPVVYTGPLVYSW